MEDLLPQIKLRHNEKLTQVIKLSSSSEPNDKHKTAMFKTLSFFITALVTV